MATSIVPLPQDQGQLANRSTGGPNATPAAPIGANPNIVPGGTTIANPYATPGATPVGTIVPGTQTNGINWADGSNTITGDLKDTYGAGSGVAISQALQGLGTSTSSAVQATIANTQLSADKQYGNIQAQEAASGITPNSSTAALAAGDFYTGVNSQLQQTISGMELSEEDTLLGTLLKTGAAHGPDESTFDTILGDITSGGYLAGSFGQAASAGVSAASPNADTSWLDAIGALGG